MTSQEERRTRTRTELLEAAIMLFRERGYRRTRNVDISAAAGLTIGALYFHFRDKRDLFMQALQHGQLQRASWHDVPRALDPATPLRDVVAAALAALRASTGGESWTPVVTDFWFEAADDEDVRRALADLYRQWVDEIAAFVRTLQELGWVDATRDARVLATHVYSLGAGAQAMAQLYGGGEPATLPDAVAAILAGEIRTA